MSPVTPTVIRAMSLALHFGRCHAVRWIVEAMKLEYGFGHENQTSINNLSPSRIKRLLLQVVSKQPDANGMYVISPTSQYCRLVSFSLSAIVFRTVM